MSASALVAPSARPSTSPTSAQSALRYQSVGQQPSIAAACHRRLCRGSPSPRGIHHWVRTTAARLFVGQKLCGLNARVNHEDLRTMGELIEAGRLTPSSTEPTHWLRRPRCSGIWNGATRAARWSSPSEGSSAQPLGGSCWTGCWSWAAGSCGPCWPSTPTSTTGIARTAPWADSAARAWRISCRRAAGRGRAARSARWADP